MKLKIGLAFAVIYLVWGSTYLAIAIAIETLPPLAMIGIRFAVSALVLFALVGPRALMTVSRREHRDALEVGALMMAGGTGVVAWAESRVPSGAAALLVAVVPLWIVLLEWRWLGRERPSARTWAGIGMGLAGVFLLVGPENVVGAPVDRLGALAILVAAGSWSIGILRSRALSAPEPPLLAVGLRMGYAGLVLLLFSGLLGEWPAIDLAAVSARSFGALVYLIVFGSVLSFSAFYFLLEHVPPAAVTTNAFVNPGVAVLLGTMIASEPFGWPIAAATVLLTVAVALVILGEREPSRAAFRAYDACEDAEPKESLAEVVGLERAGISAEPDWRVKMHPERARYDDAALAEVLGAGLIGHLGFIVGGRPTVIPMSYAYDAEHRCIYIHGGKHSRLMEVLGSGAPYSFTVTHLDGLVLAKSALHHSMNYRSAVVHGRGREIVDEAEKWAVLDAVVEHLVPGRTAEIRPMTDDEVRATRVVALDIEAASVKRREGPPVDAAKDRDRPDWAGVVPLWQAASMPVWDGSEAGPLPASVARTISRFAGRPPEIRMEALEEAVVDAG